jgi:hypothetical protein
MKIGGLKVKKIFLLLAVVLVVISTSSAFAAMTAGEREAFLKGDSISEVSPTASVEENFPPALREVLERDFTGKKWTRFSWEVRLTSDWKVPEVNNQWLIFTPSLKTLQRMGEIPKTAKISKDDIEGGFFVLDPGFVFKKGDWLIITLVNETEEEWVWDFEMAAILNRWWNTAFWKELERNTYSALIGGQDVKRQEIIYAVVKSGKTVALKKGATGCWWRRNLTDAVIFKGEELKNFFIPGTEDAHVKQVAPDKWEVEFYFPWTVQRKNVPGVTVDVYDASGNELPENSVTLIGEKVIVHVQERPLW